MQATHSAALTALKKELTWVKRQLTDRDPDPKRLADHALDVTVGCLHILADCPTLDLAAWADRKPGRRKAIVGCRAVARTRAGNKLVCDLIRLAISDLEASKAFRPTVEVGPLPVVVQTRRPQTQAQREAFARLKVRQAAEREADARELQQRISDAVAPYTSPGTGA